MLKESLSRYLWIVRKNLWLSHFINVVYAVIFLALAPVFLGISNLGQNEAARVLEQFVSITGILLLTPLFRPEGQKEIREVIEARYTSQTCIYLIRILLALVTLLLLISGFIGLLKINDSTVIIKDFLPGTFYTALFLGSLGLLTYGISDQLILGYMVPAGYFIFNLFTGNKYVGKLYLFSLMKGSMEEKYWLLGAAFIMIVLTLLFKWFRSKTR